MARRDDARLLGVPPDASAREVQAAFRVAAARAHPDRGGDCATFVRLAEARERLLTASSTTPTAGVPVRVHRGEQEGVVARILAWLISTIDGRERRRHFGDRDRDLR